MSKPVITLTTDFGLQDGYVAAMKGVMLGINPNLHVVDVSHDVRPQNVPHGAFVLGSVYRFFPAGAIHMAVVDPGVGTERRAALMATPHGSFVAPDNGLLTHVLKDYGAVLPRERAFLEPALVRVPPRCRAYELNNPRYRLHPLSNTFHGRDLFAPAAAHLSLGVGPEEMGRRIEDLVCLNVPEPVVDGETISGRVIYVDHFGNLVTNVRQADLPRSLMIDIRATRIEGLSRSYSGDDSPIALVGSQGLLEIAVPRGSAADVLQVREGEAVRIWRMD